MRGNAHVRFGERAEETDRPKGPHRASARLSHFMATEMLHAGVPLVVVSRRLDHRRVSTTLDRYAHAVPGSDAHAAATLWQVMQAAG